MTITPKGITPKEKSFTFKGWDRFRTDYDVYDLGSIKSTESFDFTLAATSAPATEGLTGINPTASYKTSLEENLALKQRIEILTGEMQPGYARLTREGIVGIDLSGTQEIEVTVEQSSNSAGATPYAVLDVKALADDKGVLVPPAKAVDAEAALHRLQRGGDGPLTATVRFEYVVRRIVAGRETRYEGDDRSR